ncbi:MAG: OmpA family protein [Bacteroidia bacterium]
MKSIYRYLLAAIFSVVLINSLAQQKKAPAQQPQKKTPSAGTNDSMKITITDLRAINSPYADYCPVISADGSVMVFTSRRPVTEKEIQKKKESMEHIFISEYNSKTKRWSPPKILPPTINPEGRMNCPLALSDDGQHMFIYRDDDTKNGDIWETSLIGDEWQEPVKLPEPINSKYHESKASLSPDGKTLYFVSDRPGGLGGRDIYYCTQDSAGNWAATATNIGAPINTKEDEEGVFIHPDGKTLYFSSKGHGGFGGYDIFRSDYVNSQWSDPVNMGEPINTPDDDVFFVMEANGRTGFYSSSRKGGLGEQDIYEVTFTPIKQTKKSGWPRLTLLKGTVIDEVTLKPVEATIEITDNAKNQQVTKLTTNSSTGNFMVSLPAGKNYGISVSAPGYLFYSENFNLPDTAAYQEVEKIIKLKKLEVGKNIVLNNIFYDFDKATLKDESTAELDKMIKLMNDNPALKVEISSYTDSKGSDVYNDKLSQARAQSVVDYLINKGVDKNRLVAKGYGKENPIASNDTDEGRQLNRRTEFKVLSN